MKEGKVYLRMKEGKVYLMSRCILYSHHGKGKGKGKAIPLQAWTGPEGSRRIQLPDFKTIGT
jgi:hypothetical protein